METGARAVAILGLVSACEQAMAADQPLEPVVTSHLASAVGASTSACLSVPSDGGEAELVGQALGQRGGQRLLAVVSDLLADGIDSEWGLTRDERLGQVLVIAPTVADRPVDRPFRALAFAKSPNFGEEDLAFAAESVPVLLLMLPLMARATLRRLRIEAGRQAARDFGLTDRELEVLQLLAQGLLATSIASRLSLSPRTIHKHLGNIYEKLGVHDRLVAVSLAKERRLVDA